MKELSTEQKARAYDEALKVIKECVPDKNGFITIYPQEIFPELKESKESEDERIRKELIHYFSDGVEFLGLCSFSREDILAWLEKQAQKPDTNCLLSWSEADENVADHIISQLRSDNFSGVLGKTLLKEAESWLKSLKDRVQPQSKQEILEKLEKWLDEYVSDLADVDTASLICSFKNYLDGKLPKSLRSKSQWEPSDEQMEALEHFIVNHNGSTNYAKDLEELRLQLKKLMEE